MAQAQHSIEAPVSPKVFYGLITDFEAYPDFLSDVVASKVLSKKKNVWEVEFTARVIKDIDYTLRLTGKPHESLTWTLIRSSLMSENVGSWHLEPAERGRTRAVYSVDLTLKRLVPKTITRMLVQARLPAMMQEWVVKAEAIKPKRKG